MTGRKWAGIVYVLTNRVTGMQYVGKTEKSNHEERWEQHIALARCGSQAYIHRAIRKYGVEKFSANVVQHCRTPKTLSKAEKHWVKKLHTFAPEGYNLTLGGDGAAGYKPSEEELDKRSKSLTIHWSIPENHEAHAAAMRTAEARANTSAAQKRRFERMTEAEWAEFGATLSAAQLLRYQRPGAIEVMCAAQAKRFSDPVAKAANAAAHRTDEFRALQAELTAAKWEDEEWRANWIASNNTPEAHDKKSATGKAWHADPVSQANFLAGVQSAECSAKHVESAAEFYAVPANKARLKKVHQTASFRQKKKDNTTAFFSKMTPEERKAYWHATHPNGNGHGRSKQ